MEPLNETNWEECIKLELKDSQKDALPGNVYSIAQLNFFPQTKGVAILDKDGKIVGFTTYGIPKGESVSKIFRLMIDKSYQSKGYGKAALIAIIKELFRINKSDEIQVCYDPTSKELKRFYASVGFKEQKILPDKKRKEGKMLATLQRNNFKNS